MKHYIPAPIICTVLLATVHVATASAAEPAGRTIPRPQPEHPGNVFLVGEEVAVTLPPAAPEHWQVVDYDGKTVAKGVGGGPAKLGRLPVGYYEVRRIDNGAVGPRATSIGVLARLQAPTPKTSPIACDVAMAWFYTPEKMPPVASLCALAGLNWVRDRLNWGEMEKQQGKFAAANRYDSSAAAQSSAGLQALQVNHISAPWASADPKRLPPDLRDAYRFYREMARRWQGKVLAFEPWNEADIPQFGGHTGSEIASLQKAAYWGLKAGNPQAIACQNVFADRRQAILEDFHANEAWPYFDTFNLHHYGPVDQYPKIYADFRAISAGKPLWVTECSVPVKWSGDEKLKEPSDADLRVQAERVAKVFAGSLHEGAAATFYFLLPHYVEGQTQFGVIRPELTPRPAFIALAAVGRLLADARPLGKLKPADPKVRGFLLQAKPDGRPQVVLVTWTEGDKATLPLPVAPSAVFDHLGRTRSGAATAAVELTSAPLFALFPDDAATKFALEAPPAPAAVLAGKPSPVVLQAVWPQPRTVLEQSAYRVSAEKIERVPIFVYNFSPHAVEGRLQVVAPKGWKVDLPEQVKVAADERRELMLTIDLRKAAALSRETVTIRGDFAAAGKPVLSLRLLGEPRDR
jgi:hypothetical protein